MVKHAADPLVGIICPVCGNELPRYRLPSCTHHVKCCLHEEILETYNWDVCQQCGRMT